MNRPSFIERAHNGDIEAMKAELVSTDMRTLAVKYNTTEATVRKWELMYGVTALRTCRYCKVPKPVAEMEITKDGRVYIACQACADLRNAPRPPKAKKARKPSTAGGAAKAEMKKVAECLLLAPRIHLSDQQGRWNRYGDESWEDTSENPAL